MSGLECSTIYGIFDTDIFGLEGSVIEVRLKLNLIRQKTHSLTAAWEEN